MQTKAITSALLSFTIPFALAFTVLVIYEKEQSYSDIQTTHIRLNEPTCTPEDEKAAWANSLSLAALLSLPVGLLGLGSFGVLELRRRNKQPSAE